MQSDHFNDTQVSTIMSFPCTTKAESVLTRFTLLYSTVSGKQHWHNTQCMTYQDFRCVVVTNNISKNSGGDGGGGIGFPITCNILPFCSTWVSSSALNQNQIQPRFPVPSTTTTTTAPLIMPHIIIEYKGMIESERTLKSHKETPFNNPLISFSDFQDGKGCGFDSVSSSLFILLVYHQH